MAPGRSDSKAAAGPKPLQIQVLYQETGERITVLKLDPSTLVSVLADKVAIAAECSRVAAFPVRPALLFSDGVEPYAPAKVLDTEETLEAQGLHDGADIHVENCPAIVTCSADCTARIWSSVSGICEKILRGHTGPVLSACFGPDCKYIATASEDHTARIWSSVTGMLWRELVGHKDVVYSASFSEDNKLAVTGSGDNTARVWSVKNGTCLHTLQGHEGSVSSAVFLPDCETVVTTSRDFTMKVWNAKKGQCDRTSPKAQEPSYSTQCSPCGTFAAMPRGGSDVPVLEVKTGRLVLLLEDHEDVVLSASYAPPPTKIISNSPRWGKSKKSTATT